MKRGGIFKECIAGADILLDSAEIEHVIGLLQEDSQSIRENLLDEACALRLSKTGAAALVARRLRHAIINCFGDTPPWPMETLEDIEATAQRYSRFFHGACLTEALRLAHLAAFRGLDEIELWQLRARLEQITSMALFDMPGAPAASELLKAREQGAVERAAKVVVPMVLMVCRLISHLRLFPEREPVACVRCSGRVVQKGRSLREGR